MIKNKQKNTVCVITQYDLENYGNRFQNYALMSFLGRNYNVIPYYLSTVRDPSLLMRVKYTLRGCLDFFLKIMQKDGVLFIKKRILFKKFSNRFKKVSIFCRARWQKYLNNKFDYFVVGSDQVISDEFGLPDVFSSLDFADSDKKIAYAISSGNGCFNEQKYKSFVNNIPNFLAISAREDIDAQLISQISKRNVEVLPDPVFLLNKEEWNNEISSFVSKKAKKIVDTKKYIFIYWLGEDIAKAKDSIVQYAINHHLDMVWARTANKGKQGGYIDMSPWDFIYLLQNAEMVFSKSFHGCAMSIVFNKKFRGYDAVYEKTGQHDPRLEQLSKSFGVDIRTFNFFDDAEIAYDWEKTNAKISLEKNKSTTFFGSIFKK